MSENNASARAFDISVHFFAVPRKNNVKRSNLGFVENMNTRRLIWLSLFELESCPYKLSSWVIQSREAN